MLNKDERDFQVFEDSISKILENISNYTRNPIIFWSVIIIYTIFFILLGIYTYFSFSAIIQLVFNSFLFEWIVLFSKTPIEVVFSALANISNFGYIFILLLFCYFIINDFIGLLKSVYSIFLLVIKGRYQKITENEEIREILLNFYENNRFYIKIMNKLYKKMVKLDRFNLRCCRCFI